MDGCFASMCLCFACSARIGQERTSDPVLTGVKDSVSQSGRPSEEQQALLTVETSLSNLTSSSWSLAVNEVLLGTSAVHTQPLRSSLFLHC